MTPQSRSAVLDQDPPCVFSSPASCRGDDTKAAISEEARLQHRPQHQRETLASRPLAEGATDSACIQLFRVNSCLKSVDERESGVVRYKCARVCVCVCVGPQRRDGDVGPDQGRKAEVDSVWDVV